MNWAWVSCKRMTASVDLDSNDFIRNPAPIFKKFEGQHITHLKHWLMRKFGAVDIKYFREEDKK